MQIAETVKYLASIVLEIITLHHALTLQNNDKL